MIFTIGNNNINNSNTCKKNNINNPLKYNKEQNINLQINNNYFVENSDTKKNIKIANNPISELKINNNENIKIISHYK